MKIVIFAGGLGTRLWPLSRKNTPKQFGKIIGGKSTLQQTIDRLLPDFKASDMYIATGSRYEQIVIEQLPMIPRENFILEPEMRDNAPAIGLAAMILEKHFKDEPIAILWSDHMLKHEEQFRKILLTADQLILQKKSDFIFIAQKARFANQNIGWIEVGDSFMGGVTRASEAAIHTFKRLRYRPSLDEAHEFLKNTNFVWNLGYFVTTPRLLVSLFEKHMPTLYEELVLLQHAWGMPEFEEKLAKIYPTLEKINFDDAILQKMNVENTLVIVEDLGWSDVGAWEALKEALAETEEDNVTHGKTLLEDTKDSLVFNYSNQLAVGIDLEGMLVINTEDVLLVCPKTSVPKIKKLVESLTGTTNEHLA